MKSATSVLSVFHDLTLISHLTYSSQVQKKNAEPATLLKKRPWHRCFLFEFCEIFKNTFFIEHLRLWLLPVSYSKSCLQVFFKPLSNVSNPASMCFFKVNKINTTKGCDISLKLITKKRERHHSIVFIANFEHISHLCLVFLLLTLNV